MANTPYSFDPHRTNPENLITRELHSIADAMGGSKSIIPNFAPFYREGLVVKHRGVVCNEGYHYYLGNKFENGTHVTAQMMYGSIYGFYGLAIENIELEYHTLGGIYTVPRSVIADYFANRAVDPVTDAWETVVDEMPYIPPVSIQFDRDGWRDELALQAALADVSVAIENIDPQDGTHYLFLQERVATLEAIVTNSNWASHKVDKSDPHDNAFAEIGALGKGMQAQDALKAYGKTIAELAAYINALGITQAHLDSYFKKDQETTLLGNMVLRDGKCTIRNGASGAQSIIDLSSGNFKLVGDNSFRVWADKNQNQPGKYARALAGKNELRVTSTGNVQDEDALTFNNHIVMHSGNLIKHLPDVGGPIFRVKYSETATLRFEGVGITSDPLKAHAKVSDAIEGADGIAVLTSSLTEGSAAKAATPKAEKALRDKLALKANDTILVNGNRFNTDITITKESMGRGNLDNTSMANKPISNSQQVELDRYSVDGHTHNAASIGIPNASTTVKGVGRARTTVESSDRMNGVSSKLGKETYDRIIYIESQVNRKLPNSVIDIHFYTSMVPIDNGPAWLLTWTLESYYYISRVMHAIPPQTLDIHAVLGDAIKNAKVYLSVTMVIGVPVYEVHLTQQKDDDFRTNIAEVICDAVGITSIIATTDVTRLGSFREFNEHVTDSSAHGIDKFDRSTYRLGLMDNKSIEYSYVKKTFSDVFDNWKRISHEVSKDARPALPAELLTWAYSPSSDVITCTANTVGFVGFVSPLPIGDHIFETEITAYDDGSNRDDDAVAVIVAYAEVDGVEHTLCVVRTASTQPHLRVNQKLSVVYNYQQSTAKLIAEIDTGEPNFIWPVNRWKSKIKSVRVGDQLTIQVSRYATGDGAYEWTIPVDFTAVPELAVFKGEAAFGYGAISQIGSQFRNITRPDEQYENFYAALTVPAQLKEHNHGLAVLVGEVVHGQKIPYPIGYEYGQVHYLLHPSNGDYAVSSRRIITQAAADRVVHAKQYAWTDNSESNCTARYMVVGKKSY